MTVEVNVASHHLALNELELKPEYRSDADNLVRDFYIPCLDRSILYRRAVGYFTSHGLAVAAQGILNLIHSGGRMLLVANPMLDSNDITAMKRGYRARTDVIERALLRGIEQVDDQNQEQRLGYLAWLIAEERLDVRIALPVTEDDAPRLGIYHEKLGIFTDQGDSSVVFTGSPNETAGGLVENFETIDVFWSWDDPQRRVTRKIDNFQRLWNNKTRGLCVWEFPEAVRQRLLQFKPSSLPSDGVPPPGGQGVPEKPNRWRHQQDAIEAFAVASRGILEMATGTGKTRTALRIIEKLVADGAIDSVIITTDGTDLLDQWYRQLLVLLTKLPRRFTIGRHYGLYHDRDDYVLNQLNAMLLISRPALAPALRSLGPRVAARTLLIHDEVHRLGSPGNRAAMHGLSKDIRYRLGLSATPEREYDQDGNVFVQEHIGPVIFRFGLDDAIRRGILSSFNYYPIEYIPDANDRERLQHVHKKAAARDKAGDPMTQEDVWIELANVYKTSRAKLPLFEDFISQHPELLQRCIVFVETQEYGAEVLRIVHKYRHDFHTYFADEDSAILQKFATGDIECLLTCHRLSEGIDIQSLETVILFSAAKARLETIQRMGRCLRVNPSDPSKFANVIDFIRVRNAFGWEGEDNPDKDRRDWLAGLSQLHYEEE